MKIIEIHLGQILNPKSDTSCQFISDGALAICDKKILKIGRKKNVLNFFKNKKIKVIDHGLNILMPAFFDMHFHWVQDQVRHMPKDNLLDWLKNYTWPYEASFKSKTVSLKRAKKFKEELLKNGTIGGMVYSSIHDHATEHGLKYFLGHYKVGNVLMDMNSPDYLIRDFKSSLKSVSKLSKKFKNKYVLTPRFAITTSPNLMKESVLKILKNKSFIQTHLSETKEEIQTVLNIYRGIPGFEKVKSYTEVYDKVGLLTDQTVLGHGIYLNEEELKLIKKRKSIICHCPTSNAPLEEKGLGSGLFSFLKVEKIKIPWVLGSDIGGGPHLSMLDVIRSFYLQNQKKKIKEATLIKGLFRATLFSAKQMKLNNVGNFQANYEANFIVFNNQTAFINLNAEEVLKHLLLNKDVNRFILDQKIQKTYFQGRLVYDRLDSLK